MRNASADPIGPSTTLFSTGRGEAQSWDARTAKSFGLRRMVPTKAHDVVDLTGLQYDPVTQMTNAETAFTAATGTQNSVSRSTNKTTTEDHQSWPDTDTETVQLPDTDQ